jgi:hypothetical protein
MVTGPFRELYSESPGYENPHKRKIPYDSVAKPIGVRHTVVRREFLRNSDTVPTLGDGDKTARHSNSIGVPGQNARALNVSSVLSSSKNLNGMVTGNPRAKPMKKSEKVAVASLGSVVLLPAYDSFYSKLEGITAFGRRNPDYHGDFDESDTFGFKTLPQLSTSFFDPTGRAMDFGAPRVQPGVAAAVEARVNPPPQPRPRPPPADDDEDGDEGDDGDGGGGGGGGGYVPPEEGEGGDWGDQPTGSFPGGSTNPPSTNPTNPTPSGSANPPTQPTPSGSANPPTQPAHQPPYTAVPPLQRRQEAIQRILTEMTDLFLSEITDELIHPRWIPLREQLIKRNTHLEFFETVPELLTNTQQEIDNIMLMHSREIRSIRAVRLAVNEAFHNFNLVLNDLIREAEVQAGAVPQDATMPPAFGPAAAASDDPGSGSGDPGAAGGPSAMEEEEEEEAEATSMDETAEAAATAASGIPSTEDAAKQAQQQAAANAREEWARFVSALNGTLNELYEEELRRNLFAEETSMMVDRLGRGVTVEDLQDRYNTLEDLFNRTYERLFVHQFGTQRRLWKLLDDSSRQQTEELEAKVQEIQNKIRLNDLRVLSFLRRIIMQTASHFGHPTPDPPEVPPEDPPLPPAPGPLSTSSTTTPKHKQEEAEESLVAKKIKKVTFEDDRPTPQKRPPTNQDPTEEEEGPSVIKAAKTGWQTLTGLASSAASAAASAAATAASGIAAAMNPTPVQPHTAPVPSSTPATPAIPAAGASAGPPPYAPHTPASQAASAAKTAKVNKAAKTPAPPALTSSILGEGPDFDFEAGEAGAAAPADATRPRSISLGSDFPIAASTITQDFSTGDLKAQKAWRAAPALLLQFGMFPYRPTEYRGTQADFREIVGIAQAAKQEFLDKGFTENELIEIIQHVADVLPERERSAAALKNDKKFHFRANEKLSGAQVNAKNITFVPSQMFMNRLMRTQLELTAPGKVSSDPIHRMDAREERGAARRGVPLDPSGPRD